ncbi:hypothetical protein PATSB16_05970 [Pandoraea thiooxydans]|nr:hypothetical protein PATSB16_05970 [Pandoraea thiooxydans]
MLGLNPKEAEQFRSLDADAGSMRGTTALRQNSFDPVPRASQETIA